MLNTLSFPQKNELKHLTLPLMVFFVGTLAALYFFYLIRELDRHQTTDAFNRSAISHYIAVTEEISENLELLASLKAFLENAGGVNQQSFARYAGNLLQNHGDVQALEWIPRIPDTARAAHEAVGQKEGFLHYAIRERGQGKTFLPATPRPEYYPVLYIHPVEGNETAIGFDLASNPARLAALDKARDSGTPIMTARITLVQEKESQAGLLAFQALYKGRNTPKTVPERRKNLLGFTAIVIRVDDMVDKATHLLPPDILLNITDNTDAAEEKNLSGNQPANHPVIHSSYQHVFAGRKWHFIATPSPGAFNFSIPLSAFLTFIAAMVAASLGGMFIHRLSRENIKIAREVGKQTSALKVSDERYALAVSGSAVGLWDWDISENKTYWSPRLYEILGIKDPTFTPSHPDFEARLHPDDKQHVLEAIESHLLHDTPYDVTYRLRADFGDYIWIHAKGQALRESGAPVRVAGSMDDISSQVQTEKAKDTAIQAQDKTATELQVVLDTMVDGLIIINKSGIIQQTNPATTSIFGYGKDELLGQNVSILMPELYSIQHNSYMENFARTGIAKIIGIGRDLTGKKKTGEEFSMSLSIGHIIGGGKEMAYVGTVRDISGRAQAAKKLQQSEERFMLATKSSGVGIWDRPNVKNEKEYWSPQFYSMLGYEEHEMASTTENFKKLLWENDVNKVFTLLATHFKKQADFDIDFRLKTKSRGYRWFRSVGQASWGKDGKASRMVGSIQDIHAQKTAELDIRAYALELQRSNADLEQFAYVASHDLKAPLRGIHNLAEWIEENIKDTADEETRGYLDMLKVRVSRLENLLAGLLAYSKIGSKETIYEEVDLNTLVAEVGGLLIPTESALNLKYDLPP
ncbi:MAG: CHASE domain-containing protein, partial [Kordiimonadaceae bacterium]|nr:CHASE domain-containing protein [Kordiimonadaceae bacterium]